MKHLRTRLRPAHYVAIIGSSLIAILVLQLLTAPLLIQLMEQVAGHHLSDRGIIRIRLAFGLTVAATAMFIVWTQVPPSAVRAKLTTFVLLAGLLFSIATLLFDTSDFLAEESKMTGATGFVLLLASLAAYGNYWACTRYEAARPLARAFWALLSVVFAAAAFDELFMLHERIGRRLDRVLGSAPQSDGTGGLLGMQDILTLIYAASGLAFVLLVVRRLHRHVVPTGTFATMLAAVLVYVASVSLDSFGWLLDGLIPTLDLVYLANSLEEVLELLAAGLFLSAFLAALLERNGGFLLHKLARLLDRGPSESWIRVQAYSAATLLALIVVFIHTKLGQPKEDLGAGEGTNLAVVSSRWAHPSLSPDGMAVAGGTLYIANDQTSSVISAQPNGHTFTLADSTKGLQTPESIAVAPDGTVYVTDDGASAVFAIRPEGVSKVAGRSDGLRSPKGIAIDPGGTLHIADAEVNAVFSYSEGQLEQATSFVGIGTPEELAFDSHGTLYVTQESPARVYKVEPGGKPTILVDERAGLGGPESIAVVNDHIYVADSRRGAVFRFTPSGTGNSVLHLTMPLGGGIEGLALDDRGNTFVGVRRGRRSVVIRASARSSPAQPPPASSSARPERRRG